MFLWCIFSLLLFFCRIVRSGICSRLLEYRPLWRCLGLLEYFSYFLSLELLLGRFLLFLLCRGIRVLKRLFHAKIYLLLCFVRYLFTGCFLGRILVYRLVCWKIRLHLIKLLHQFFTRRSLLLILWILWAICIAL